MVHTNDLNVLIQRVLIYDTQDKPSCLSQYISLQLRLWKKKELLHSKWNKIYYTMGIGNSYHPLSPLKKTKAPLSDHVIDIKLQLVVQYCFKASFTQVFLCVHSWAFFIYTGCTGDPCICVQVVPFMSIGTQPLVPIWQLSKTHT